LTGPDGWFRHFGRNDLTKPPAHPARQQASPRTVGDDSTEATDPGSSELQDRLLPAAEVAVIVRRGLRTLSNWESEGILVPVRIRGRRMYRLSAVLALLHGAQDHQQQRQLDQP
jgi:hypothetical protein